jgi:hypothetical protein
MILLLYGATLNSNQKNYFIAWPAIHAAPAGSRKVAVAP